MSDETVRRLRRPDQFTLGTIYGVFGMGAFWAYERAAVTGTCFYAALALIALLGSLRSASGSRG